MSLELVQRHEPVLRFDHKENFFPMRIDDFIGDCSLHIVENEQRVMYIPPKFVKLDYLDDKDFATGDNCLVYADRADVEPTNVAKIEMLLKKQEKEKYRSDFIKFVKDELHNVAFILGADLAQIFKPLHEDPKVFEQALKNYTPYRDRAPAYYYRVIDDVRGYTVVQYWYFYAYNDFATSHKGINDHEGDWESVLLYFKDVDEAPFLAVYSAHGGGAVKEWQAIERDGDRPVVYVAAGSHGGYYQPGEHGRDHNDPGDRAAGGSTGTGWAEPASLDDKAWCTTYQGRWGARKLDPSTLRVLLDPMGGPPTGPAWNRDGTPRLEWLDPIKYAGLDK